MDWISSTTSGLTPLALAMWGCWARYWVSNSLRAVDRGLAILVHRADDELRPVDVVQAAAGTGCADLQLLHRFDVVLGRHAVVEDSAIGNLAGQLHHLGAGCADHDFHIARLAPAVDHVQLDAVERVELTLDRSHSPAPAGGA